MVGDLAALALCWDAWSFAGWLESSSAERTPILSGHVAFEARAALSLSMESCHALILRSASLRASHASDSSGVLNILGQPFSGGSAGTRDERLMMYVGLPIDVEVLSSVVSLCHPPYVGLPLEALIIVRTASCRDGGAGFPFFFP